MKNVLVVGGAGYIGSHTVRTLGHAGYNPVVYDDLSSGHEEAIIGYDFIAGEIADKDLLSKTINKYNIKAVMHFAGKIEVAESVRDPLKYLKNNLVDSTNIILAMVENNIRDLIFSSTAAVYGEPDEVPILESAARKPANPYGLSKHLFENVLEFYSNQGAINYVSLRYFNAAGADPSGEIGADHPSKTHLITLAVLTALKQKEKLLLYGTDYETIDGTCIRDYIHVNDLAAAHLLALEHLSGVNRSDVFNLGSGNGYSNRQVIDMVKKVAKVDFIVEESERREGDPAKLIASSQKAIEVLGWKPKLSDLETIISTAYQWHKEHPQGYVKRAMPPLEHAEA